MRQEKNYSVGLKSFLGGVGLVGINLLVETWVLRGGMTVAWNQGGVLNIFPSKYWLIITAIIVGVAIIAWFKTTNIWVRYSLMVILAGGVGNLLNRVVFGSVMDYIYYPRLNVYGNLNDIYLGVGVSMIIWGAYV